mgnify:CR=1 FL=1
MIETNTPFEVEDNWLIWLKEGDHNVLEEDKDPKYYTIENVKCDKEGSYYKQFSLPTYKELLKENHTAKKKVKKKLTSQKMGAKLKKEIFTKTKKK